jgi:hypothetical protein
LHAPGASGQRSQLTAVKHSPGNGFVR